MNRFRQVIRPEITEPPPTSDATPAAAASVGGKRDLLPVFRTTAPVAGTQTPERQLYSCKNIRRLTMKPPPTTTITDDFAAIDETNRLIASNRIAGTAVYQPDGEHIGSVHNFMVDKLSGKVAYAVMSFGGFLGIGERYHPLPWDTLKYDPELGGYVVNVSRAQLESGPHHALKDEPWGDPEYGRRVHGHYGLPYL